MNTFGIESIKPTGEGVQKKEQDKTKHWNKRANLQRLILKKCLFIGKLGKNEPKVRGGAERKEVECVYYVTNSDGDIQRRDERIGGEIPKTVE